MPEQNTKRSTSRAFPQKLGRMIPLPVLLVSTQTRARRFGESIQNKSDHLFYCLFIRDVRSFSAQKYTCR